MFYKVSFEYSEGVFCTNVAHAESADAVRAHYSKYTWSNIREAAPYEISEAREKGMPFVEIPPEAKQKAPTMSEPATTYTASPRTEKARAKQQVRRAYVRDLISKANGSDPAARSAARAALALIVGQAISHHNSGKIEGLHSLDTACRNNAFCPAMQTCGDPCVICSYCYTLSMWDTATAAHAIIGEILSQVEFTHEEAALVPVPGLIVRYNSDGEIINETHARNLIRIAAAHPLTTFAVWTKRPAILSKAITEEGKPANLVCGISSIRINTPAAAPFLWIDFVFTVYTPEGMKAALARGEHECNGRKCMECGFRCYHAARTEGGPLYVAEALRKPSTLSKADFEKRLAEIDRATLNT